MNMRLFSFNKFILRNQISKFHFITSDKGIVAVLICIGILLSHGIANSVNTDFVLEGNKLYEKGEYAKAAAQYQQAIKNGQNIPFAWFNLGNCYAQHQQYAYSIVAHKRSVEEAPQFVRPWVVLADIYFTMGAYGYAMVSYRRALELDPENSYAWKWRGECALKAGDVTEAMKSFDAALKLDPDQIDVYFALAESFAKIKDYEGAQDVLMDAILLSPKVDERAYFYLAYLYEQEGNIKKAIRAYEEGLALNPKKTEIYFKISNLYRNQDSDYLALLALESALEAGIKDSELHLERGVIFFEQDRLENALEEFKIAYSMGQIRGRDGIENVSNAFWNKGEKEKAKEVMGLVR